METEEQQEFENQQHPEEEEEFDVDNIVFRRADPDDTDAIINFHPMRLISLATGGEHGDYDFVSYVAKDKDTGKRECQVFDCGTLSDDVLHTLGQAFNLAQELAQKQGRSGPGYLDVAPDALYGSLDEAMKPAAGAEAL